MIGGLIRVVTAVGGTAIYDERPSLKYRQHANNVLGSRHEMRARLRRILRILDSKFKHWNEINISALLHLPATIEKGNKLTLDRFMESRNATSPAVRLLRLYQSGVYRQTVRGNLALIVACILRRI